MAELSRRAIFAGIGAVIAAPAIVKATSLMPVRGIIMPIEGGYIGLPYHPEPRIELLGGSLTVGDWITIDMGDFPGLPEPALFRVTGTSGRVATISPA